MARPAPLALTSGEPAGIAPEITVKAWQTREARNLPPFFLIGDTAAFAAHRLSVPVAHIDSAAEAEAAFPSALPVLHLPLEGPVTPGHPAEETAPAIIASIERAVALVKTGDAAALITNPIQKRVLYRAGFTDPGHTEFLARLAGRDPASAVMMLAIDELRVVPLTVHVPLASVPALISRDRIERVVRTLHRALIEGFGISAPRLAVAGLNPHAGEGGDIGEEEKTIISPAIRALAAEGIAISGPHSADTLFHASARAGYDAALCMYHDQALIPLKTLDFHGGVNITLGLPFIRTSPDHGTALDIAGRGVARPDSLIAAIETAGRLAARAGTG